MIPSGYLCLNRATTSGSSRWIPSSWFPRVILKQGERQGKPKILEFKGLILLNDVFFSLTHLQTSGSEVTLCCCCY
uniref:Uncharacterized protein n=1 Tax=Bos indicus x Bos taurus TaxID=30522 RepID=A0A4W2D4A6_BOBOX